jgi:cytochrome c-type biogenesis protein CcmH
MNRRYLIALAAALLLAGTASASARAAEPRASLPDIEDEVMCPSCGTPLALAFSPQAERERNFIREQIAAGRTKEQIKDALVAEYGKEVLALPDDSGFDLAAYLVPAAVVLGGAAALAFGLLRWRRRPPPPGSGPDELDLLPADSARLERDISRYDL